MKNKKAFSFVELIIVLSIIALLAIVVTKLSMDSQDKTTNAKVKSDITTLKNALLSAGEQEKKLPLPDGNLNYFTKEGKYSHEDFSAEKEPAFGVYGKLTEKTLGKKYLSEVPLDPRTKQYYSYGMLREGNEFEVAGVSKEGTNYKANVAGNYRGDKGTTGLIREYNGPYFVIDEKGHLPYNPEEVILTASDRRGNMFRFGDNIEYKSGEFFKNGVKIETDVTVEQDGKKYYDLYFSDGNIGRLEIESENIKLTFGKDKSSFSYIENNKKSKIAMFLEAGSLWIFASNSKESGSEFEIETQDITAAVRGTIFRTEKNPSNTKVDLYKGMLWIKQVDAVVDENKALDGKGYLINTQKNLKIPYIENKENTNTIIPSKDDIIEREVVYYKDGKIETEKKNLIDESFGKLKDEKLEKIIQDEKYYGYIKKEVNKNSTEDYKIIELKRVGKNLVYSKDEGDLQNNVDYNTANKIYAGSCFVKLSETDKEEYNLCYWGEQSKIKTGTDGNIFKNILISANASTQKGKDATDPSDCVKFKVGSTEGENTDVFGNGDDSVKIISYLQFCSKEYRKESLIFKEKPKKIPDPNSHGGSVNPNETPTKPITDDPVPGTTNQSSINSDGWIDVSSLKLGNDYLIEMEVNGKELKDFLNQEGNKFFEFKYRVYNEGFKVREKDLVDNYLINSGKEITDGIKFNNTKININNISDNKKYNIIFKKEFNNKKEIIYGIYVIDNSNLNLVYSNILKHSIDLGDYSVSNMKLLYPHNISTFKIWRK
ncbi:hypothetical protein BKN14_05660 [Candidatus Gracilibacteria bacterium HOT-871]|nr:hypothetical protein BKN14_05660 [Candidatus Gracilibacteria bacterium HOT-871]